MARTFTNKGLATPASAGLMGGMETPYLAGGVNTGDRASGAPRARAPVGAAAGGAAVGGAPVLQMPTVGKWPPAPKPAAAPAPALISGAHGDDAADGGAPDASAARAAVYRAQNVAPAFGRNHPGGRTRATRAAPRLLGRDGRVHRTSSKPEMPRRGRRGCTSATDAARARRRRLQPDAGRDAVANAGLTPRRVAAASRTGHGRVKWNG